MITAVQSSTGSAVPASPVRNAISQIASRVFKELTLSLSIGAVVSCFVAAANIPIIFQACAIQCAVSLFFHTARTLAHSEFCEWIASFNFAIFTAYNAQVLIHEAGHACAALAVYAQTTPHITLIPFGSAATQFQKGVLSAFGKKIGAPAATCLIVAGGPALTLLVSAALFSIGLGIKDRYPTLSKYLISWALLDFICSAHYAYTAIGNQSFNFSHDFVHLSVFGLSPTIAVISIAAIPVIAASAIYFSK